MDDQLAAATQTYIARRRRSIRIVAVCFGLLCLMAVAYRLGQATAIPKPLPAIVATLPGDETQFSAELDRRLRERFPAGSAEANLIDMLKREGFEPDWRKGDEPNSAIFVHQGLVCRQVARVMWRAGATGDLVEVGGDYEGHCL